MAAPPRPKRPPSCSPAVPPPPVCGAPVGIGVAVGLGLAVAVTLGVAVAVTLGEAVTVGDAVALTDGVVLGVPVALPDDPVPPRDVAGTVAVPLATAEAVVVPGPTEGEKIAGTEEPPPLQADTDPESRTAAAVQPTAVSLALLAFIRPPCIPGWRRR
jgi:hypothetical protein